MSDPTGYRESPDTTDGPVTEDQTGENQDGGAPETGATLTTDDEAQSDDGVVRPGNQPD
jgi:hypothetical protein